jgi:DNA helicase-2/ATP-dependent DNA helicase PcrA
MGFGEGGPSYRQTEPSRFLGDLPPELFGLPSRAAAAPPAARAPTIRRHPGALEGEPHIELDDAPRDPPPLAPRISRAAASGPTVDYSFDQRPDAVAGFDRGARVQHPSLGEGTVMACEGAGAGAKVTVFFDEAGEKRVLARFLRPA